MISANRRRVSKEFTLNATSFIKKKKEKSKGKNNNKAFSLSGFFFNGYNTFGRHCF